MASRVRLSCASGVTGACLWQLAWGKITGTDTITKKKGQGEELAKRCNAPTKQRPISKAGLTTSTQVVSAGKARSTDLPPCYSSVV